MLIKICSSSDANQEMLFKMLIIIIHALCRECINLIVRDLLINIGTPSSVQEATFHLSMRQVSFSFRTQSNDCRKQQKIMNQDVY